MRVVCYKKVIDFLEDNQQILLENEAVSQLVLSNALAKQWEETSDFIVFGKVTDESANVKLLFCNVLPYSLSIYASHSEYHEEAIKALANYISSNKILIKGVIANKQICDIFNLYYKRKFKEYLALDIMELRKLNEVNMPAGECRKAVKSEYGLIALWMVDFAKDALDEKIKYTDQITKAEVMVDAGVVYIYENPSSEIVSMAAATRKLLNGISINWVYTPKKYRGKGYAAANMYYMSKDLLENGNQFCTLLVNKRNPISNHVYKKIGYKIIDNLYEYHFI